MKSSDRTMLETLRKGALSHIDASIWSMVEAEVEKAGDIRNVQGYARNLILDGVTKQQKLPRHAIAKEYGRCAEELKVLLANTVSIYHEAQGFHWNVKGQDFAQYHELFGEIASDIYGSIDPIAENILKLGQDAPFQLSDFIGLRTLSETTPATDAMSLATDLLESLVGLVESLNTAFDAATAENQQGVADFLAGRIDETQKWVWQLRASNGMQKATK